MVKVLQALPQRDKPWRVLDAGCGVGTESLLWAMVREDVQVLGTDVSEGRLAAAQARVDAYASQVSHSLSVSFVNEDVFDLLASQAFDVVWTMEALSHIAPAEKFLADVYANLPSGGSLLISDSHLGNPAMAWRIFKLRREGVTAHTQKTLASGKVISYAQERLFTVGQLSTLLEDVGFRVAKVQLRIFFPPSLARYERLFQMSKQFDSLAGRMPLLRNLGGIYTIVARK